MNWTPGRMEVRRNGRRYWGTVDLHMVCGGMGWMWKFWSDHEWPFYHGHFAQRFMDCDEAMQKFREWLP